jgi:hypothetical protein
MKGPVLFAAVSFFVMFVSGVAYTLYRTFKIEEESADNDGVHASQAKIKEGIHEMENSFKKDDIQDINLYSPLKKMDQEIDEIVRNYEVGSRLKKI